MTSTRPPALPRPTARADLLALGITDAEIRADLRAGRLVRLVTGVYLEADRLDGLGTDDRERVRIRGAALRSPELVLSHRSAAAVHGLPLLSSRSRAVHFIRPGSGGGRRNAERQVHVSRLPDRDRMTIDGLHVTTVARTLFDLGRTESLQTAVVAADGALRRALVDGPAVERVLADQPSTSGRPRSIRALRLADGRSESPGETLTRLTLRSPGVPALELQVEIFDERGTLVGRPDLAVTSCGVLLEFDGRGKYTSLLRSDQDVTNVVLAEKRREERLTELGWLVIRVTWADLARPEVLVQRVVRACRARRRLVAAGNLRGSFRTAVPVTF